MTTYIPILMLHGFDDEYASEDLQGCLEFIGKKGYMTTHLNSPKVLDYIRDPIATTFPEKTVVLTFDDALYNFYTGALPLLRCFRCTVTVCVPTAFVSDDPEHRRAANWKNGPNKPTMTWPEIRHLVHEGLEIIPHSATHIHLSQVKDNETRLRQEIIESRERLIEELKIAEPKFFCLPYGDGWRRAEINRVLDAGTYSDMLRADYQNKPWDKYCIPRWQAKKPCEELIQSIINSIAE